MPVQSVVLAQSSNPSFTYWLTVAGLALFVTIVFVYVIYSNRGGPGGYA